MIFRRATILTLLAALPFAGLSARLRAQQQSFHLYGTADGLTNLNVRALLQDRTGFLWIGTDNGLFRFDGVAFREFTHADGLPSTEIRALAESPAGELWAATQSGLVRLDASARFVAAPLPIPAQTVTALAFSPQGELYIAHTGGILHRVPDSVGGWLFQSVVTGPVGGLLVRGNDLLFAWQDQLWRVSPGRLEPFGQQFGLPADLWAAIATDSRGNLWVRSATRLFELPRNAPRFLDRSGGVPSTQTVALAADTHGRIYASTLSGAVAVDGPRVTPLDTRHGLPAETVGPILIDRDDSLWIGLAGAGLVRRLGRGEWTHWKTADGLPRDDIWSIREDALGRTWVGTGSGLAQLDRDGHVVRSWTTRSGLPGARVLGLQPLPDGSLFVGTDPTGLTLLSSGGAVLRKWGPRDGILTRVVSLTLDREGRMWVLTDGRVLRSREPATAGAALHFDPQDVPTHDAGTYFRDIRLTPGGVLWIASSSGLLRFAGNQWTRYTTADGLRADDLDALALRGDRLWVVYRDAIGMSRFRIDGDHIRLQEHVLPDDDVYSLVYDSAGRLWAGTDRGVQVLAPSGVWQHLTSADGLVWDDTDSNAEFADAQGRVWIGTSGGLSLYTPSATLAPQLAPAVILSAVHTPGRTWSPSAEPTLPFARREITLQYTALTFTDPHPRFRYRLDGYSSGWVETTGRTVQFAALPAGSYVFQVEARGPGGDWTATPAEFHFAILAPWWMRWPAIGGGVLALFLLVQLLWKLRIRTLLAQQQRLQRIVDEQTAELRKRSQQMEQLAFRDQLTGLPNRRAFNDDVRRRIGVHRRTGNGFVLLLVDLDRFKQINDTHGHDAGDAVLAATAARLQSAVRNCDTVARLGGDEFAILLHSDAETLTTERETESVEIVCRRILENCARHIPFARRQLSVGCSLGIAAFPTDAASEDRLYKAADLALYQAKRSGRNTFCWFRTLDEATTAPLAAEPTPNEAHAA